MHHKSLMRSVDQVSTLRIIRIILILGKLNSQCDKAIRMKNLLY